MNITPSSFTKCWIGLNFCFACRSEPRLDPYPQNDAAAWAQNSSSSIYLWMDKKGELHAETDLESIPDFARQNIGVIRPGEPLNGVDKKNNPDQKIHPALTQALENRKAPGTMALEPISPVIIYGAEWCGPCHVAASWLKEKNLPFIQKDIEKDEQAAQEMNQKMRRAGLTLNSIPVLDVRGKIMVGFSPSEITKALQAFM